MKQLELWNQVECTTNAIWVQLDPKMTSDLVTRLAQLMVKAVDAGTQKVKQEGDDHER